MNTRIKMVRINSGLSQEAFASRIGLTKNFISLIETGNRVPSERTISDIAREFGIRREWLETGELPMEEPRTRMQILIDYIDSCMDQPDSFKARFAEAMAKLSDEQWVQLAEIFTTMTEKKQEP